MIKCLPGTLFLWGVKRDKVSSRDPFLWGVKRDKVSSRDPFFYGMALVDRMDCIYGMDCITYTARISCVDYDTYSTCSASNVLLSFSPY